MVGLFLADYIAILDSIQVRGYIPATVGDGLALVILSISRLEE
jgi:hypothetical protein